QDPGTTGSEGGACSSDLHSYLPPSAPDCPAVAQNDRTPCDIVENGICFWPDEQGYTNGCGCYAVSSTTKRWECSSGTGVPGQGGPPRELKRLCLPQGLDESREVKSLVDAEARAWCEW